MTTSTAELLADLYQAMSTRDDALRTSHAPPLPSLSPPVRTYVVDQRRYSRVTYRPTAGLRLTDTNGYDAFSETPDFYIYVFGINVNASYPT